MSTIFVVESPGGGWGNDDEASPGPAGVYSSRELAAAAVRALMQGELETSDTGDEPVDRASLEKLSFEDLTKLWADRLETKEFTIFERELDAPLRDVYEASADAAEATG
jgi:hypothetical protein